MNVLGLFVGKWGWEAPFLEDGDAVVGIDLVDFGVPKGATFIRKDIRKLGRNDLLGFQPQFVIGSPPCDDSSKVGAKGRQSEETERGNVANTLDLIDQFHRIAKESGAMLWAFENVTRTEKFYPAKPAFRFKMGSMAQRSLWANFSIPLAPDFRFPNRILASRTGRHYARRRGVMPLNGQDFARIPYPIARYLADIVKERIHESNANHNSN